MDMLSGWQCKEGGVVAMALRSKACRPQVLLVNESLKMGKVSNHLACS